MEKEDLLTHLQKRYKVEWVDEDFDVIARKFNVHPDTVKRIVESGKTFNELVKRQQREIVRAYLEMLNERLKATEEDEKKLIIK